MTDLRQQLSAALGDSYHIVQELGGGGMSHVFLADETGLGRQVVIKVLPPDMAAGVNEERFRRETQLAARLQHPHIVPLLTAGAAGGLLYYVMPFIKGESLRARLGRERELPVADAVRILREVTDALAYAHGEGVVHRDIKPDNVMISGGHALVTDFGIAKAVTESASDHSLTSMGMAIGTPTYMAPEQAAGDHVDHRADIYALGAMAFEMLTGRPPFVAQNAQGLLAAHISQMPPRVSELRPAVPPGLDDLVARCLQKRAADRWPSAQDMLPQFDMLLTGSTTMPAAANVRPARALGLYGLAGVAVAGVAWLAVRTLGLPTWVLVAAVALVVAGLPVVFLTATDERGIFTWRRARAAGAIGFSLLAVLTIAYTAMRLLGIGAVGTLFAKGALSERDRIVLADFDNRTPDSTLGATVTELLRTDLSQSRSVSVYDVGQLGEVMTRMRLPRNSRVSFDVAKDVATRQGLKAVLAGDISSLGTAYVLNARLVATKTGEVLWATRETASADKLSAAVDHLSAALRAKIGESLRSIRADPALDEMTTASVEALRVYAQSDRASNAGDRDGAIALLQRALTLDSNFASAHRKLGVMLRNRSAADSAHYLPEFRKAYDLRDRLTARERYLAEAGYYTNNAHDTSMAVAAYRAVLDRYPDDRTALNNLALMYRAQGKNADALALYKNALRLKAYTATTFTNALGLIADAEGVDSAEAVADEFMAAYPENPAGASAKARCLLAKEQFDSAKTVYERMRESTKGNPGAQGDALTGLGQVAFARGHLNEAIPLYSELARLQASASPVPLIPGVSTDDFLAAQQLELHGRISLLFLHDTAAAQSYLSQSYARVPAERRAKASDGQYAQMASQFAQVKRLDLAHMYWQKWEAGAGASVRANPDAASLTARAEIERGERKYDDALSDYRAARAKLSQCKLCYASTVAEVFADAGQADSSIYYYDLAINTPQMGLRAAPYQYAQFAAQYEKRGDKTHAIKYYQKVVDQWKDADPPLQPQVKAARGRIAALSAAK